MECGTYEIRYYCKADGENPVKDFVQTLSSKSQQKFYAKTCMLLKTMGPRTPMPHAKPLGDGLYELRVQHAEDTFRILYFFSRRYIVLTNGFRKKTKGLTQRELEIAKVRRNEILEGIRKGEIQL